MPTHAIASLPDSVEFRAAVTLPVAGLTVLLSLRGRLLLGQSVLITGTSGGVGYFALSQAFEQIHQTIGTPELLIYNAAVMKEYDPLTISSDEFVNEFKVTVAGALTSIQQVAPPMKSNGFSTILLTGGALAYNEYSFPPYLSLVIGKAGIRKLCFVMEGKIN